MIELRITLDEIDYDRLAEYLVPLVAEKMGDKGGMGGLLSRSPAAMSMMVKKTLKNMNQKKRDEFMIKLLTEHKGSVLKKLNGSIGKRVSGVRLSDIAAYRLPDLEENK